MPSDVTFTFRGRSVLVTGAARGIGLALARGFARADARVWLLDRDARVTATALDVRHDYPESRAEGWVCDVRDREALEVLAKSAPGLDVLVSNAGVEVRTPLAEADPGSDGGERFRDVMDVNVGGTWNVMRTFGLRVASGGSVVVTSSIWGKIGAAGFSAYSSSKHALIGMVRTLASELGQRGVTINAVCPGWVRTEASMRSLRIMAARAGRSEDAMLREVLGAQALPALLMEPEDVVDAFLFLASRAARHITGQELTVDRGELRL